MLQELQAIQQALAEGLAPEEAIARLEALHEKLMENPEERSQFEMEVLPMADGVYMPHIFWIYLAAFLQSEESRADYRPFLEHILQVYAQLPPSPFVEKRLRPLVHIYFAEDSPFYMDKLHEYYKSFAHPEKRDFIKRVKSYLQRNPKTVSILRRKFHMLTSFFPNFQLFSLPIPELEKVIGAHGASVETAE
ncbi:MAG: hypothetical protein NZ580_06395 [Bacteroidia bacterium]|nr:hypothetical protein [Bacteroidia bacterium]MDW8235413.1 hypothetical protein [Bacteroidia bacterium]